MSYFGRQKHPTFNTYVQRKGIEIRAGEGSIIRAVLGGTVVYADWLKGYGLVIITIMQTVSFPCTRMPRSFSRGSVPRSRRVKP